MNMEMLLAQGALAALNVGVAALVLGIRPRAHLNVAVGVLFAGNAVRPLAGVMGALGATPVMEMTYRVAPLLDDAVTVSALLLIPLLWRVRDARQLPAKPVLGLLVAFIFAFGVLSVLGSSAAGSPELTVLYLTPLTAAVVLGALVFVDASLDARSPRQQSQAHYFLAAYLMVATIIVSESPRPLATAWGAAGLAIEAALTAAPYFALAAACIGIGVAHVRRRIAPKAGEEAPPARRLAVLLAIPLAMWLTGIGAMTLTYLLARPILFAYGFFRHRLLGFERHERAVIGVVFASALLALFVETTRVLTSWDQPLVVIVVLPVSLVLVTGVMLGAPLARDLLGEDRDAAARRNRDVYMAALEESLASDAPASTTRDRVMGRLRARLRISDREHALMELEARRAFGHEDGLSGARILNRYRIVQPLGEGGFGRALLAHDEMVGRDVVLKMAKATDEATARALLREARLMARVDHPSVVRVLDVERVGSDIILVLEHVPGGSLAERIARDGALGVEETRRIGIELLGALEAAHALGIVHRDVKPSNVLLPPQGPAKLADFGIARAADATSGGTAAGFSLVGEHPGSVRYMSPEQVRGMPLDGRSDLYSLAATLVEALTGRTYIDFTGRTDFDARLAILEEPPGRPEGAPEPLATVLTQALAKEPTARPASADAFRRALVDPPVVRIVPVSDEPTPARARRRPPAP